MITVAEVVNQIVKSRPLIEEGLSLKLINFSELARNIQSEVEEKTKKEVTVGSIVMALRRLERSKRIATHDNLIKSSEIVVRSNIMEITIPNSDNLLTHKELILQRLASGKNEFFIHTQGVFETTILCSQNLEPQVSKLINESDVISIIKDLSAITIRLDEKIVYTPGAYYLVLKLLAWEGVNVIEVASTYREFTIILEDKDVDRAFSILKNGLGN